MYSYQQHSNNKIDNLYCYLIIQSVYTNILNLYKYAIDKNAPTVSFSIK